MHQVPRVLRRHTLMPIRRSPESKGCMAQGDVAVDVASGASTSAPLAVGSGGGAVGFVAAGCVAVGAASVGDAAAVGDRGGAVAVAVCVATDGAVSVGVAGALMCVGVAGAAGVVCSSAGVATALVAAGVAISAVGEGEGVVSGGASNGAAGVTEGGSAAGDASTEAVVADGDGVCTDGAVAGIKRNLALPPPLTTVRATSTRQRPTRKPAVLNEVVAVPLPEVVAPNVVMV